MKKRIISLLLAAAMTFSLTACGGNSSDDKKEETKTENTDNKETPEVDTIHWARANSGNILVTIAKQQGYFDEVGINVIEDPVESSTAALQALQAKQVDEHLTREQITRFSLSPQVLIFQSLVAIC